MKWRWASDERPLHKVCLDDYLLDKYEVTQQEYEKLMGHNPADFDDCPSCPVESGSWFNARDYCLKPGKRLPTEAEWE